MLVSISKMKDFGLEVYALKKEFKVSDLSEHTSAAYVNG